MPLTRRQHQILEVLRERALEQQSPPSLRELCQLLGLRSRGSLHKHIQALVAEGLVEPLDGLHRGIQLSKPVANDNQLPLLGKIAAGRPIAALPQPDTIEIPPQLCSQGPCYVLQVEGDSMRDIGILDGDWVVIEQRDHAQDGEVVVALINGEEATLKRILQQPGRTLLYPENSTMAAQEYPPDAVQIQGVLIGQMRRY